MSTARLASPALRGRASTPSPPVLTALCNVLLGPVAIVGIAAMMWIVLHGPVPAFDFRFAYWAAGHRVLTGHSPYIWSAAEFRAGKAFVYPALSAVAFAPTALIPRGLGAVLFTLLSAALAPATLWVLRVRDWRLYGITLLWLPVCAGWLTANESLFLVFGLACLWRWRDHPLAAGLLVAVLISLKPMMWPLALWLLCSRRWRASAYALGAALLLNLAAWALVGFSQIGAYLHATARDTDVAWRTGFGIPALLAHLGAGRTVGMAAMLILSLALVLAVIHAGFIRHDQTQALALTVALAIVASPLVWGHYLVLLLVPLALLRPRLDWLWALPIVLWVAPPDVRVHIWQATIFWIVTAVILTRLTLQAARRHDRLSLRRWDRLMAVRP
jgi:hypothetical protein